MKNVGDLTVDELKNIIKEVVKDCLKDSYIEENYTWIPYGHQPIKPYPYNTNEIYCNNIDKDIKM